jgi:Ras-related GTP-binding protein A/B
MSKEHKIPGTSWSVQTKLAGNLTESLTLNFKKMGKDVYSYTLEKEGGVEEIFELFLEESKSIIPEIRLNTVIEDIESDIFDLEKKKEKSDGTKALKTMIQTMEEQNKKILILGLAGAGKTSIYQVVFEGKKWWDVTNMTPTRGIQRYQRGAKNEEDGTYNLVVWDMGGQRNYFDDYHNRANRIFPFTTVLIFVIDAVDIDKYDMAREELKWAINQMKKHSNDGLIYCLIHKMDEFSNYKEKYKLIKNFIIEEINQKDVKINFLHTSIKDDSIYSAWEEILKSVIPKSQKLDILANNLKNQLGIYNVLVLEKRTGFPICASSSIFDSIVIVGTINKLWESTLQLIKDLDLVGLEKISIQTGSGFMWMEEFGTNYMLICTTPEPGISRNEENRKIIENFKQEMKKYI